MDMEDFVRLVGVRLKEARSERGWTLDHLAAVSGVSRRMLVNVERGETNPSIATLLRLSDALGVGLPALVEPPHSEPVRVTLAGSGAVLWQGEQGGRALLVAGTEPPNVGELWDWTLGAGDRYASDPHAAGTRELLQVQEGTVLLQAAGQSVTLAAGDAAAFAGDVPHSYSEVDGKAARFSLAVFEPGVGPASSKGAAGA